MQLSAARARRQLGQGARELVAERAVGRQRQVERADLRRILGEIVELLQVIAGAAAGPRDPAKLVRGRAHGLLVARVLLTLVGTLARAPEDLEEDRPARTGGPRIVEERREGARILGRARRQRRPEELRQRGEEVDARDE